MLHLLLLFKLCKFNCYDGIIVSSGRTRNLGFFGEGGGRLKGKIESKKLI